jgi:hypothetical protein
MATLEQIDAAISATKSFVGVPTWKPNPSKPERSELSVPLRSASDEGIFLELRGHATLTAIRQRGGLVLLVDDQPVQRINIFPDGPHTNPFRQEVPAELRGIRLPPHLSRIYLWSTARYLPAKTEVATVIEPETTDFDVAVRYFLETSRIVGDIPSPPHTPRLFP